MRVLDLFSGVGGFSLGLEAAGMETVAFCEREPFCQAVLRKHWPDIPIHDDITELDGYAYRGTVELVCGGFPCQPFSVAGKRRGAEDDRALWPEMLRVIREVQPTWVIGENVTGIIAMELDTVLSDLESEGYACQTFVLPACAVDAPHRRDRVWVIGYTNSDQQSSQRKISGGENAKSSGVCSDAHPNCEGEPDGSQHGQRVVADPECRIGRAGVVGEASNQSLEGREKTERSADSEGLGSNGETMANTSGSRLQGGKRRRSTRAEKQPSGHTSERGKDVADADSERRRSRDAERQNAAHARQSPGHPRDDARGMAIWESEPSMGRVANGVPNRSHRLKSLGNAVVPQVVEQIGKAVMEIHDVAG